MIRSTLDEGLVMNAVLGSVKGMLLVLVTACGLGFAAIFVGGMSALGQLDRASVEMGQGKDVVADILPPPLYVIEAHLTVYQLIEQGLDKQTGIEKLRQLRKDYDDRNTFWNQSSLDSEVKASLLGEQKQASDLYFRILDNQFIPAIEHNSETGAHKAFDELKTAYAQHRAGVDKTVKVASSYADRQLAGMADTSSRARWLIGIVGAASILMALAIYFFVARRINALLGAEPAELREEMARFASGDLRNQQLSTPIPGSVLAALAEARDRIRALVTDTASGAQSVDDQVGNVSTALQQLKHNSARLADSAMTTSAAMEEISATIAHITELAQDAETSVGEAFGAAQAGDRARLDSLASVQRLATASRAAQDSVSELGTQSQQVSGIVQTIREIADQTNLLALNAAIEAARAGEQGRGFAVVADEVRKLAERTTLATAEIGALINAIRNGIEVAVTSIKQSASDVDEGIHAVEDAGNSLVSIQERISIATRSMEEIAAATREVTAASQQVAVSMEEVGQLADAGNRSAEVSSTAGEILQNVSTRLRSALRVFSY